MQTKNIFFDWLPVCGYMGLIYYLSSQTAPPYFLTLLYDKLSHFLEYLLLSLLLVRAMQKTFSGHNLAVLGIIAFIITVAYAVSDEVHQHFVPGRNAAISDWLADALGAGFGSLFILSRTKPR